jgi:hypothetical protein
LSQIQSAIKKILDKQRLTESTLTREFVMEFSRITQRLSGPLDWKEWIDIHVKLSEIDLELERFRDVGLKQSLMDLKKQSASEFGRYVTKNYQTWIKQ